jgi:hypothetical protein
MTPSELVKALFEEGKAVRRHGLPLMRDYKGVIRWWQPDLKTPRCVATSSTLCDVIEDAEHYSVYVPVEEES